MNSIDKINCLLDTLELDVVALGSVDCICAEMKEGIVRLYDDNSEIFAREKDIITGLKFIVMQNEKGLFCDEDDLYDYFWELTWLKNEMERPEFWDNEQ